MTNAVEAAIYFFLISSCPTGSTNIDQCTDHYSNMYEGETQCILRMNEKIDRHKANGDHILYARCISRKGSGLYDD